MKYLFKNITLVDSQSQHNGKTTDVLVENGTILKIDKAINDKDATVIEVKNACLSPGWIDLCANLRDPGYEHKESLDSGVNAAIRGGFTQVAVMPTTKPIADGKTQIEYCKNRSAQLAIELLPIGALSQQFDGETISEMYDMHSVGAVAFSDYKHYVRAGLMSRAMLYAKNFGGKVFSFPYDPSLSTSGMMHEGKVSTILGLKGIPELSEELIVSRDIYLAEYNASPLHFLAISSVGGIAAIEKAQSKKLPITAQIAAHQLYFSDEDLQEFDTNLKVLPPLRSQDCIEKFIQALKNNSIAVIVSDHCPEDTESKKVEFDHAEFGISSIETAFAAANKVLSTHLSLNEIIDKFTVNPRRILDLAEQKMEVGESPSLTLFDANSEWTYDLTKSASKSRNSPYHNKVLKGKAIGVLSKGKWISA